MGVVVGAVRTDGGADGRRYYWANVRDTIDGRANRDFTLSRWAVHVQNDFRARLAWCVTDYAGANHPPEVVVGGARERAAKAGERIELDASGSRDPDGQKLSFQWMHYPEASGYRGAATRVADTRAARTSVTLPAEAAGQTVHLIVVVTDEGSPALTRYGRIVVRVSPGEN